MKESLQFPLDNAAAEKKDSYDNPVHLTNNPTLKALCDQIAVARPDWDSIKKKHQQAGLTQVAGAHGIFAEIFLHEIIREAADTDPKIDITPIDMTVSPDNFHFTPNETNGVMVSKEGRPFAEYDGIILADSLPVVFESKTKGTGNQGTKNKRGFNSALRPERIAQIFEPLQEYFKTDTFGYVVIRSKTGPQNESSELQANFKNAGGIIVQLSVSSDEFREEALHLTLQGLQKKFNSR